MSCATHPIFLLFSLSYIHGHLHRPSLNPHLPLSLPIRPLPSLPSLYSGMVMRQADKPGKILNHLFREIKVYPSSRLNKLPLGECETQWRATRLWHGRANGDCLVRLELSTLPILSAVWRNSKIIHRNPNAHS